jgi:hypothetical protein
LVFGGTVRYDCFCTGFDLWSISGELYVVGFCGVWPEIFVFYFLPQNSYRNFFVSVWLFPYFFSFSLIITAIFSAQVTRKIPSRFPLFPLLLSATRLSRQYKSRRGALQRCHVHPCQDLGIGCGDFHGSGRHAVAAVALRALWQ